MKTKIITLALIAILSAVIPAIAQAGKKNNAYGQKHYTVESAHFRIHYHRGLEHLTPRVAGKLEELYHIYSGTYRIVLPQKTDVVLYESEIPDAFAYTNFNFLYLGVHDYEFNLRGSSDWFDDVITHEYAHVVSIFTGLKFAPAIPEIRAGYFSHPNTGGGGGMHSLPSETMPVWFLEGIAQYESSRIGADKWDTHRDMILRTLTLSGKMLSWANMQVFAGKGDDYEKSYNHGFSLITYIADTYGYDKIVSILRENAKVGRLSFDGSVKAVLGISAAQLYSEWQESLSRRYREQIKTIGEQRYGRKINEKGYDNLYPAFSPDGKKVYFVSNDEHDYSLRDLYSYNLSDTVPLNKRVKYEMPVRSDFDIHAPSGKIAFVSMKSRKSVQDPKMGGQKTFDLFIDELPPEKPKFFSKNTEKQVTEKRSVFAASFSPAGDKLACAVRKFDRFFLAIVDTSGKDMRIIYPRTGSASGFFKSTKLPEGSEAESFSTIFSLAWSPSGKDIAVDYIDGVNRKIGIYDTLQHTFSIVNNTDEYDQRTPSFNKDGSALYFSSDETGIFNVYRYIFKSGKTERLTNVTGGAFSPAVSSDEKKLVYSGYDRDGYGIYLIDTIKVLKSAAAASEGTIIPRPERDIQTYTTPLSNRIRYSSLPKQWLFIPTLIAEEQIVSTRNGEETRGIFKGGVIANFMDPLAWAGVGNEGGAYLLIDIARLFDFINFDKGFISPYANYDAGAFLTSKTLPVTIDAEASIRGITDEDWFYEEIYDSTMVLPYRVQLTNLLISASHPVVPGIWGQLFLGLDRYDAALDLEEAYDDGVFSYNLNKGYRAGAMAWFTAQARNARSNISPKGLAAKLQYSLWQQHSLKDENSFALESSILKEQYDNYLFHYVNGRLLLGMGSPLYPKHDIHLSINGSYLKPIGSNQDVPSYYYPLAFVPGYALYYKDAEMNDTALVTGKAVLAGEASYRFPLLPDRGRINRKLGFIYFDRLYGALNFNAAAGFASPAAAWDFNREDWLFAYGAELRLEAQTFNNYPLAVKFRWDYGADRETPQTFGNNPEVTLGGHRFALSIGYSFDDWHLLPIVDYFAPARFRSGSVPRPGK
ncbi:MAG: peptidase MA family metallohydrolase [Chitinispirillia bacterium]|nr:peptidase MA family metallohydrolase [Chitinispirillia bacterium]MCL2241212.1 peptidase MA family metallohydrolase [Chitinispirillia bacterium]